MDITATTDKDSDLDIPLLADNADPSPGDTIQVTQVDAADRLGVPLTLEDDGSVDYACTQSAALATLTAGQSVTDTFDYTITDSRGLTSTGQVTVTVTGENDPPQAAGIPDVAHAVGGAATTIELTQYFSDEQDAAADLTYTVADVSNPALFSSVSIDPTSQLLTLNYAPGAFGTSYVTICGTDSLGLSAQTTFAVRSAANVAAISGLSITPEISEGETVTLSGQLSGNGPLSLTVDWGDGDPQTFAYPAGTTSFSQTHEYTVCSDDGSPYEVELSLCDAVGMWDEQEVSTQVTHVAPTLGSVAVTGATYVGDTGTLTGTISEPNPLYNYTLQVGWGDGSTETYTLPTGATTFSESYQFQGESSDVDVTLMDDHGDTVTADAPVSINYLLGSLANLQVPAAPEGGTSTLSGNIVNARATDTLSVEVDWGDGSDPQNDRLRGRVHVL